MNKFKAITIPVVLMVWLVVLYQFIQYSLDMSAYLNSMHLSVNVNYAVDAAVEDLVASSANLDSDYIEGGAITIEPQEALDTFCEILVRGMGWSPSAENIMLIKTEYIKAFLVAGYDGYYIAKSTRINDGGAYDLLFTPKMPYVRDGRAYNLGFDCYDVYDAYSGTGATRYYTSDMLKAKTIVNTIITDEFNATVAEHADYEKGAVYFPSALTELNEAINPIENVSILVYVQGIGTDSVNVSPDVFTIGGSRVAKASYVVAYERDGQNWYAFANDFIEMKNHVAVNVHGMYESAVLAAEAGYSLDILSLDY